LIYLASFTVFFTVVSGKAGKSTFKTVSARAQFILATLHALLTNNFVTLTGNAAADSWIGLTGSGGSYTWIDGSSVGFYNWQSSPGGNKCVYMRAEDGLWVDTSCSDARVFACKQPESKSSLFGVSSASRHAERVIVRCFFYIMTL